MPADQRHLDQSKLQETVLSWLQKRLDSENFQTLKKTYDSLKGDAEDWEVFSSFSRASRYTGKEPLKLSGEEISKAESLRSGWMPSYWTTDQLARTLIILGLAEREKKEFLDKLDKLFTSSDLGEGVALYQSLPVLPYPDELTDRAAEGIRTNITSIFNAVAHRNPYPADFFDDNAWNQVILKSLFMGSPIYLIQGVDERANEPLARILVEYAHERWSAGREVSPELWRSVGPFIDETYIPDVEKELTHDNPVHRHATVLALMDSNLKAADRILKSHDSLRKEVESKNITWDDIGKAVHNSD
ncbi:EboA domain-containing protein [Rhodohalobacter sp. 8-1]|uniref:EboA domain-containing protein n=1 Tax=Rhodohalobacter sp. 8-1 TaxID=3131972 RepID=UPI0030EDFD5D